MLPRTTFLYLSQNLKKEKDHFLFLFSVLFVVTFSACASEQTQDFPDGVVAFVDDVPITGADLSARFVQGPREVRLRSMKRGGRHYLLDLTIDDTLLFIEARRQGFRPNFTGIMDFHRPLMKNFLRREFDKTINVDEITESEIRAEYNRRIQEHRETELTLDIKVVYRRSQEKAERFIEEALKAHRKGGINELKDFYRKNGQRRPGDPPDTSPGPLAMGQAGSYLGEEVEQAAFSLDVPDEAVFPEPVRYHDGWGVVLVTRKYQAPDPPTFEEEKDALKQRLFLKLRDEKLPDFVETFRKYHKVTIQEENMKFIPWVSEEN